MKKLVLLQHGGGRIMYHDDKSGDEKYEYQYYLTDHLGNVRTTFTTQPKTETAVASMEETSSVYFADYDQLTRIKADLLNHTTGGEYAVRLNGSDNEKIGLSRQLKVKPGDVINMDVYAKYLDTDQSGSWAAILNTLVS